MRAGSQRVKNKNTRLVNGRHLFEYIIDTVLKLNEVNEILINTDIIPIKKVIKNYHKVKFIDRPDNLKGNCDINKVIEHSIKHTENDYFIQIHATNPLLTNQTLGKQLQDISNIVKNLIVCLELLGFKKDSGIAMALPLIMI